MSLTFALSAPRAVTSLSGIANQNCENSLTLKIVSYLAKDTRRRLQDILQLAGFYAENLLLYSQQAQKEAVIPLPIGKQHKFAPIALGDVSQVAAHVLSGQGKHGFSDQHRGQLIVLTGPMLATGDELATAASKALGQEMAFEDISEAEAKRVLRAQSASDESELQYLIEYYSLVREGKTNYISTTAFHDITGAHPQEPEEFFRVYADESKLKSGTDTKRRKLKQKR
ncbi:hypothetical protein VN97_g12253 [Penicillium thymicola]|uniref:Uncharacterized protein n=1 Tax=Penicillium thymicola TaxID=293382 RepID=A0AAI9T6F0_PENTH|nr:hypothetical protein VN97_g12253 [Penicillium thymicola]